MSEGDTAARAPWRLTTVAAVMPVPALRVAVLRVAVMPAVALRVATLRLASLRFAVLRVAALLSASLMFASPATAHAQAIHGRVLDSEVDRPLSGVMVRLVAIPVGSRLAVGGTDAGAADTGAARTAETADDGAWRFDGLPRGRYRLSLERFGYRGARLEVTLERDEPLVASVRLVPVPFPVAPIDFWVLAPKGPTLRPPVRTDTAEEPGARAASLRSLQGRSLSADARQLGHADVREANTVAEDDLFRTLQRLPGVGTRDDFTADLWTRGAPPGQTAVLFDGIPVRGGLHALGAVSGLNTDMLSIAAFQPGVVGASLQGAGAAVVEVTSRSGMSGPGGAGAVLSPLSARVSLDGRRGERVGWAFGARRSYIDALSRLAAGVGLVSDPWPYAFRDATARVDAVLDDRYRVEASAFWQDDRVFGDVPGVAYGNEGMWGTFVARGSLVGTLGGAVLRHTVGVSRSATSLETTASNQSGVAPLHPPTEGRYRTVVWESRVDPNPDATASWSLGVRASHEVNDYSGPGLDVARMLSHEELERRGIGDLTHVLEGLQRAELLQSESMLRVAAWGERRWRATDDVAVEGGARVESGSRVGASRVRLAPRVRARWHPPGSALALTVGVGRSFQYAQSIARTDVVRPGLRASEVIAQAGPDAPAVRSDLATLGAEAWAGDAWVFGAALWLRASSGVLVPEPTPGLVDGARAAVAAEGRARGLEASVRRIEGPVRGFANYTLSRSRYQVGVREFAASEDRRHMANAGVTAHLSPTWMVGATATAQSGAPYTRITLVDGECTSGASCSSRPPVLYGSPGLQRSGTYGSVDLMAERSFAFSGWSLTAYAQLRNVLGSRNAVTYHSSCVCAGPDRPGAPLHDQFDEGLPRLPLIGLRARF